MAVNNVGIYNAALEGAIAGSTQRWNQDSVEADYAPPTDAAVAFATQVDSKIPFSVDIGIDQADMMRAICTGLLAGRTISSIIPTDYDAAAIAVVAFYNTATDALAV